MNKDSWIFKIFMVFLIGIIIPTSVFLVFFYIWGLSPLIYITSGLSGALSAFLVILIIDYGMEKSGIKRFLSYFGLMYIVLLIIGNFLLLIYHLPLPIITEILFSSFFGACAGIAFTFVYPTKSIKQQNNIDKNETNDILQISERIVNRAYKIDKWGRRLFGFTLLSIFFLFYTYSFRINSPKNEIDRYFYENILPLISMILIVLIILLMIIAIIILFFGMLYKQRKEKSYDKKKVIQLLLLELTNNLDKKRKMEILKLLTFNLTKLLDNFRMNLFYFSQYEWKQFFRMNRMGLRYKYQIISKISSFVEQAIIFLNVDQYKDAFIQIGTLLINDDYNGLNKLLIQNDTLFKEMEIIKKQTNLSSEKHRIEKVKNLIIFTSNNYKFVLAMLAVLLFIYLLFTGKLSNLPGSLFSL